MKKVRVTLALEFEVPDETEIGDPTGEEGYGDHLKFRSEHYMPGVVWMKYEGKEPDGTYSWSDVDDDDMDELIIDNYFRLLEHSIQYIDEFTRGDFEDEETEE